MKASGHLMRRKFLKMSPYGDIRGETAKSLPTCKAVPKRIFDSISKLRDSKMRLGEPQELCGNTVPRYMIILDTV